MNNIILCGLPRCGKTSVGKILSKKMSLPFVDTDKLIEEKFGKSCRQIFLESGEMHFRKLEKAAILSLQGTSRSIVSLGGGSLMDGQNREFLKEIGTLVYLHVEPKILWQRMLEGNRPSFIHDEASFYTMVERRLTDYSHADVTFSMPLKLDEEELWQAIRLDLSSKLPHGVNLMEKQ